MWIMTGIASGKGVNYMERPGDACDYSDLEMATWCLLPTYQLLDAFTRVLTPGNLPVYNGQFGWPNLKADRSKMSNREKYETPVVRDLR